MKVDDQAIQVARALGVKGAIVIALDLLPDGSLAVTTGTAAQFDLSPQLAAEILLQQVEHIVRGAPPAERRVPTSKTGGN